MKRWSAAAAVLVVLCGLAACGGDDRPPVERVVIAAGGPGGVYEAVGTALAKAARDRWSTDARVLLTAGSVENLQLVADGRADIGFTTVDAAALAINGEAPFRNALTLAALASLYDDYLQIVVRADSNIEKLADLRGKRVSIGLPGSGSEIVTMALLSTVGINPKVDLVASRLSAANAAESLRGERIDAFFFTAGLPTPAVADLAADVKVNLLSVETEIQDLQDQFDEYYVTRTIPAGMYGLERDVVTIGIANVLAVRRETPERDAYRLTELLYQAKPAIAAAHGEGRRIDPRSALATFPLPLHPGAQRYYRDVKPMAFAERCPTPSTDLTLA
jgi:hypothetical protein